MIKSTNHRDYLTNIIQFPTTHTEVLGPYSYDTPITPEFLMEFCEEYEIDSIELFTAIFSHCLEDIEEEMEEDTHLVGTKPIE